MAILPVRTFQCQYHRTRTAIRPPSPLHIRVASIAAIGIRGDPHTTDKESHTVMPRVFAAILLVAVLVIGGGIIATTAYQAGLVHRRHDRDRQWRHGRHAGRRPGLRVRLRLAPGFGIFGFFATLFFLFIVFGLIRAIFWRGGRGRHGGWGRGGWGGPGGWVRIRAGRQRARTGRHGKPGRTRPSTTGTAGRTTVDDRPTDTGQRRPTGA